MKAKDLITKAKASLILDQPFFASLILKMQTKEDPTTPRIWINGKAIGYNPAWIETKPLEEVKGLLCHEISHIVFLHHLRRKGRDADTWNQAGDYAINSIVENAGFKLPPERLRQDRFDGKPTEDIFNTLMGEKPTASTDPDAPPQESPDGQGEDQQQSAGPGDGDGEQEQESQEPGDEPGDGSQGEGTGDGKGNGSPDGSQGKEPGQSAGHGQGNGNGGGQQQQPSPPEYSGPGGTGEVRDYPDPDPTAQKQAEEEIKIDIIQSAQYAKKHGKLPAEMERYIQELLNPVLPWREILARFIDTASKSDYSWTRPNPRYMAQGFYLPALNAPELGKVVLAVDTSGSISPAEIQNMVSEVKGILNAYPGTELTVIFCNAAIQGEPETLTQFDELKTIPRPGGGTDFKPPFTWTEENQLDPKAFIYFTDGECNSFPDPPPDYPVLWILTQEPTCYPWEPPTGETTYLNPEDRNPER